MNITPEAQKKVQDAVDLLMEHFDSVRIFVTAHDGNSGITQDYSHGSGNFYSQYGQVQDWIGRQNEYTAKDIRKGKI